MYKLTGEKLNGEHYEETFTCKGECFKKGFEICLDNFERLDVLKNDEMIYTFDTETNYEDEIDFRIKQKEINKEHRFIKEYSD